MNIFQMIELSTHPEAFGIAGSNLDSDGYFLSASFNRIGVEHTDSVLIISSTHRSITYGHRQEKNKGWPH